MIRFEEVPLIQMLTRRRSGPRAICQIVFFCLALGMLGSGFTYGEEIDRLIVAVNGKVITEGDLDLARSLNRLVSSDKIAVSPSRDDEINRLIDLELMQQELKSFSLTQEDESKIEVRMKALRDTYSEKGGLPALLQQLGLQELELSSYLRLESSILKFVDFRFRPFINVSKEEIRDYYEGKVTPQLRKAKLEVPVLTQVSAKIEEILREEKINEALNQWISQIRRNSRIEYFDDTK